MFKRLVVREIFFSKLSIKQLNSKNGNLFKILKNPKYNAQIINSQPENPNPNVIYPGICMNKENVEKCEDYKASYSRLILGNREFVKEKKKTDPEFFEKLSKTQKPKYLMIGCSDSRVPPNELTKTDPGEIFIHRNVANQVLGNDLNCMSVLQFAVEYLGVEHIIVMGHTNCGGIIAANKNKSLGLIDQWLQNIRDVALIHKEELDKLENEQDFVRKLTELNIKQQVLNVCKTNIVQKAWADGKIIHVHGWLCDLETGLINDLAVDQKEWQHIKGIYRYVFKS